MIDSVVDDMVTVLDALVEERCVVLGLPAHPALVFAATHPARSAALALFNPSARFRIDEGNAGHGHDEVKRLLGRLEREWGTGVASRLFGWDGDERLERWFGTSERLMHSPREVADVYRSRSLRPHRATFASLRRPIGGSGHGPLSANGLVERGEHRATANRAP
jgi:hypothetical protein